MARGQFATLGVDTDAALAKLSKIPVSLHCWQGDDVGGFEPSGESLGGGLAVTGNYLGVGRMQIEAVIARDERECLGSIGSQFVGGSGFAEVVAGDG